MYENPRIKTVWTKTVLFQMKSSVKKWENVDYKNLKRKKQCK